MKGAKGRFWAAPVAATLAAALIPVSSAFAASPVRFAGQLSGLVTDSGGKPQSGAMVFLFNRQERLLQRALTDGEGNFSFDDLLPDLYSVRVTMAAFVPAIRDYVQVRAGMRSLLDVSLSKVFSSIQLVSTVPAPGGLMNDNWKWTLRADSSMRPILRMLPQVNAPAHPPGSDSEKAAVFSDSRGFVRISAADGPQTISSTGEADLGTQFAFATSVYGGNHVKVTGNMGYAPLTGSPATALRTTYSRDIAGASPTVSVTMRQMSIPLHASQGLTGSPASDTSAPALRSVAVSFSDKAEISDVLSVEYGFEFDNVSFLDRLHYFSPYSKLTYALPSGTLDVTYTSGNARPELGISSSEQNADLQRDLAALSVLPRVTLAGNQAKVQRGDEYEIGLTERFGSREYRVAAYRESVANTTLTIAHPEAGLFPGDLLPDLFSNSALFNIGRFDTVGYMASVTQNLGSKYKVTATYGSVGVMAPKSGSGVIESAEDLRTILRADHRPAVTLQASGAIVQTGTRFVASYQWTDYRSAMPGPLFSTQSGRPEPGLNVLVRQPLPSIPGMPCRIEATAELRNMLAQGYLPLPMSAGRQLLLVNTPRSVRGGLAFIF